MGCECARQGGRGCEERYGCVPGLCNTIRNGSSHDLKYAAFRGNVDYSTLTDAPEKNEFGACNHDFKNSSS